MRRTQARLAVALAAVAFLGLGMAGQAAASEDNLPAQKWSFKGIFGTYDRAAAQRGLQVYKEVCSACHSLDLLYYRNLTELGYSVDQVKAFAAEFEVQDGPNDEGDMFMRPARPSDRFVRPFPNPQAARASNNGALPPDLSLMVKARNGGADYLYAILTGYEEPPADFKIMEGMNYNKYFPGNQIAMPQPLSDEAVEYQDGTKATVPQMAKDVSVFLAWASEPTMEARKSMGIKVILFLLVFTGMLIAVKRKIGSDVH